MLIEEMSVCHPCKIVYITKKVLVGHKNVYVSRGDAMSPYRTCYSFGSPQNVILRSLIVSLGCKESGIMRPVRSTAV